MYYNIKVSHMKHFLTNDFPQRGVTGTIRVVLIVYYLSCPIISLFKYHLEPLTIIIPEKSMNK